jgi:hypothetical protein
MRPLTRTHRRLDPVPALRRAAARRRLVAWAPVVVLAAAVGLAVTDRARALDETRQRWGTTRTVLVTTGPVAPGDLLDDTRVQPRALPEPLLPDGASAVLTPGSRARHALPAGAVVTAGAVAGTPGSAAAAAVPAGWRGLAVARGDAALPLAAGDAVDVIALGALDGDAARAVVGIVTAVDDAVVTVAVDGSAVAGLATAVHDRRVLLALRPG